MAQFLREDQFERVYALLRGERKIHTQQRERERRSLEAVYWVGRGGAQRRCLPSGYGAWSSV